MKAAGEPLFSGPVAAVGGQTAILFQFDRAGDWLQASEEPMWGKLTCDLRHVFPAGHTAVASHSWLRIVDWELLGGQKKKGQGDVPSPFTNIHRRSSAAN